MAGLIFSTLLVTIISLIQYNFVASSSLPTRPSSSQCWTLPGDPNFPSPSVWAQLNASVNGNLLTVVPSAEFCEERTPVCSDQQWNSSTFRGMIPGAMNAVNWEQDYTSDPPSLCFHNGTSCGQGNVPVYAINVTQVSDIQAGLAFASAHNIKLAIKASGHDFLGRSTARGSLLIWTHYLRNISFSLSFTISDSSGKNVKDVGPAVTVGSGVPLNTLYEEAKKNGLFYVGGSTATVVLAGGYLQGAGHSAFSPVFGLGADNVLEFKVVLADGRFVTANELQNSDLFWAMRGGGAGSWGVVVSVTVRTYPAFSAAVHNAVIYAPANTSTAALMALHARHIFDWDKFRAGQYYTLFAGILATPPVEGNILQFSTYFANESAEIAFNAMQPILEDAAKAGFLVLQGTNISDSVQVGLANDLLFSDDVSLGLNILLTSRLIPAKMFSSSNGPEAIGKGFEEMIQQGVLEILGNLIAGGKVAENANIDSAVHPKWRAAKSHVIAATSWPDTLPPDEVINLKHNFTHMITPILVAMTGESDSGAYSNEADVLEPDFQTVFYGKANYGRLSRVKRKYDPNDMFIVGAGIGSERWDLDGLCRNV